MASPNLHDMHFPEDSQRVQVLSHSTIHEEEFSKHVPQNLSLQSKK